MEESFETKTLAAGETLLLHDKLAEVVEGNLVDGEGFVFRADELIGVEAVLGGSHLFHAVGPTVVRIYPWEPSLGMIERLAREVLRLRKEREQIRLAAVDESLMAGLRERGRVANTQSLIKDAPLGTIIQTLAQRLIQVVRDEEHMKVRRSVAADSACRLSYLWATCLTKSVSPPMAATRRCRICGAQPNFD